MTAEDRNVEREVLDFVDDWFRLPHGTALRNNSAVDIKGWDSIAHAEIVLGLEEKFGIGFSSSEISRFENIGSMIDTIMSRFS